MIWRFNILHLVFLIGLLPSLLPADNLYQKAAIPDSAALKDATKLVNDAFKDDLTSAKKPDEKAAVAKKLLDAAKDEKDMVARFALFTMARDLASNAGDFAGAIGAIDEMDKEFAIDTLKMKEDAAAMAVKLASTPEDHGVIAQQYLVWVNIAVKAERFPEAEGLGVKAQAEARLAETPVLLRHVQQKLGDIHAAEALFSRVGLAIKVLVDYPNDPAANLTVGRYTVFVLLDYQRGLPMLAKGNDAGLRQLAEMDLASPAEGTAQEELANKWWAYAEKNERLALAARMRAQHWYEEVVSGLTGMPRSLAEKRIAEVLDMVEADRLFPVNQPDVKAITAARSWQASVETRPLGGKEYESDQMLAQTDKPYQIADVFGPAMSNKRLKVMVGPGVEIREGTINLESPNARGNAELLLAGSRAKPIILRHIVIDHPLGGAFKASNVIFDQCSFRKTGFWYSSYSSRWEMDNCLLYKCSFGNFSGVDYGFKITNCTLVGMNLPEIEHEPGHARFDDMDWLRKDWNVIRSCNFVDCDIFPTVFWCSESCNFWYCTFQPGEAFESNKPTQVLAFVTGTKGKNPDQINRENPPKNAPLAIEFGKAPFKYARWSADFPIPEVRFEQRIARIVLDNANN